MKAIFTDDEQGQDHVYGEYKGFLIVVYGEYKGFLIVETRYVWGHEVVAIPDNGETLRRKFIGYNRKKRAEVMRDSNQTEG
jgi:hypothetical protein